MTAKTGNNRIEEKLKEKFNDSVLYTEESYGMLTIAIDKHEIVPIVRFLAEDEEMSFSFLTDLCGIHYQETEELGVIYHLHNFEKNIRIRLKTAFAKDKPDIDSIVSVFSSANWMERETYDFFGICFKGHPDLRRILNMDEMDYFPLRKEYPVEDISRTDKNDAMFGR